MNLHLFADDKFFNSFIRKFEEADRPGNNVYLCVSRNADRFEYLTDPRVIYAPPESEGFAAYMRDIRRYDKVFFHGLQTDLWPWVAKIPRGPKVCCVFLGWERYVPERFYRWYLYDADSRRYLKTCQHAADQEKTWRLRFWEWRHGLKDDCRAIATRQCAFARIDYFLCWNEHDFNTLAHNIFFHARHAYFSYESVGADGVTGMAESAAQDLKFLKNKQHPVVLLGNSAAVSGNHISVLRRLRELKGRQDFMVMCPLSYGDPAYAEHVSNMGRNLLGERFFPLRRFMDRATYFWMLSKVDCAVMNHRRQQAAGNILMLLSVGRRVAMNTRSSLYPYFRENTGMVCDFWSVQTSDELLMPLPENVARQGREFIAGRFSDAAVMKDYKKLVAL